MKPLISEKIPSYYTVHSSELIEKKAHAFSYHPNTKKRSSSHRSEGFHYRTNQTNYPFHDPPSDDLSDKEVEKNEEYVRSERLHFQKQKNHLLYHLPLHSERVHVTRDNHPPPITSPPYHTQPSQEYSLSTGSQRQLRHLIDETIHQRYAKVERILHTKLLKPAFHHWKEDDHPISKSKIRQHMKYYYPLLQDQTNKEWYQHRASQIMMKYLFFRYSALLWKGFLHWKCVCQEEYWMKRHFYDRWIIKASIWKLARLTAQRFVTLLYPIVKKYLKYNYLHHWKVIKDKWKHYRYLRMIFRIWKFSILAFKKYKKQQCRKAIGKLLANRQYYQQRDDPKIQYLTNKTNQQSLQKIFYFWKQLRRKKGIMLKFISLITKKRMYLRCWNQWKSILPPKITLPSPNTAGMISPKYSPREPTSPTKSTFIRAVYQNPSSTNEYRQVTISKKKKLKGLSKLDWKHMTALERLEYRLRYVKHMDHEFLKLEQLRHESFRRSLEEITSFHSNQPVSSQESVGGKMNILCRHSHDNCLYCNYCYRDDDASSSSSMRNYVEERFPQRLIPVGKKGRANGNTPQETPRQTPRQTPTQNKKK